MKAETTARIEQYRNELPRKREKIFAAAMMLAIAIISAASATYAWITLSASPEVTSIDTTVAANGSLEIAMANGTGAAPGRSAAGDSTGAGTAITDANTKWGNLVNLSDPSYGLANVTLRPAALNGTTGLLSNPLYGVGYGEDGRVTGMVTNDDFRFTYFEKVSGKFLVDTDDNHLGVRAISTVQYENLEGTGTFRKMASEVRSSLATAKNNYIKMTDKTNEPGKTFVPALEGLMGAYATCKADSSQNLNNMDVSGYIQNLYNMLVYYRDNVINVEGESYVQMVNMITMIKTGEEDAGYTVETLVQAYNAGSIDNSIKETITSFDEFASEYSNLQEYLKTSEKGDYSDLTAAEKNKSLAYWAYYQQNGGTVYWKNINGLVNWLCDINEVTLNGTKLKNLGLKRAMELMNEQPLFAVLHEGSALYKLEKRTGADMNAPVTVTVKYMGTHSLNAIMSTSAEGEGSAETDLQTIQNMQPDSFKGGTPTAQDTYALAVDMWLRTNAGSPTTVEQITSTSEDGKITTVTDPVRAYLTLEGAVLTKTVQEPITMTGGDGKEYPTYEATFTVGGQKEQAIVILKDDGNYYVITEDGEDENFEEQIKKANGGQLPQDLKYKERSVPKEIVVGYEGVNRVWDDEQMAPYESIEGTSTTQGGGSCYIFYAKNPTDQSRFLELLESMRVAFIDADGNLIGAATMDTEHYYAENGKVTVPLTLDKSKVISLGVGSDGKDVYALTALVKNAATRITAIVYLDGTKLSNQMVLASGDIQGNLNIQFGSYVASKITTITKMTNEDGSEGTTTETVYKPYDPNESVKYEPVMDDKIAVTASVSEDSFEYNKDEAAKTTLRVVVDGVTPKNVHVRFIRAISATQGVQQEEVQLEGSGADWSGEIVFDKPGNYVLRTVWVDGVEYDLNQEPVYVKVSGSSVNSLSCDALPAGKNRAKIMTANSSFSTNMTLGFSSSEEMPNSLKGVFEDAEGRNVMVTFKLDKGVWKGTATFNTSGIFTMKYVSLDGEFYEVQESLQPTLELLLGLKTSTSISASADTLAKLQTVKADALPTRFVFDKAKLGADSVTLNVSTRIYDNSGNEIRELTGVNLYYGKAGSDKDGLDAVLAWNEATEGYTGDFLIRTAGTYSFTKVTVKADGKTSEIKAATSAPNIQVMPPDDVSYYGSTTEAYQFCPNKNGVVSVELAYSNAASNITATLKNQAGKRIVVENTAEDETQVIMGETTERDGKTVTEWIFAIPDTADVSQEGEWSLEAITLYGVYYNKVYYGEEGVTIDLSAEHIRTKVVNYVRVTLAGTSHAGENAFTGTFMTNHPVDDMTVTIEDYEHEPIQAEIGAVKVAYWLNSDKVSMDTYGYTASNLSAGVIVDAVGSSRQNDATVYDIGTLNFQQAGPYETCTVTFMLDGEPYTASTAQGAKAPLQYRDGGRASEMCPQFDVKWTAPTVKITGLNPDPSKTYDVNAGGMSSNPKAQETHTYISPDGFYAHMSAEMGLVIAGKCISVTWPKMTLTLSNVGTRFSTAVFSVTNGNGSASGSEAPRDYTFKPGELTQTEQIGITDGSRQQAGNQKMTTIVMNYNGVAYTMKLSNMVEIYEVEQPIGTLTFQMPVAAQQINTEELVRPNGNKVTLPEVADFIEKVSSSTNTPGSRQKVSSSSETVYYRKGTMNYQSKKITTTVYKTPYTGEAFNITYRLKGWTISGVRAKDEAAITVNNGNMVMPGATVNLSFGVRYTAIPVLEEMSRTSAGTMTTYFYQQETTAPNGTSWNMAAPDGIMFKNEATMNEYVNEKKKSGTFDIGWKDS